MPDDDVLCKQVHHGHHLSMTVTVTRDVGHCPRIIRPPSLSLSLTLSQALQTDNEGLVKPERKAPLSHDVW